MSTQNQLKQLNSYQKRQVDENDNRSRGQNKRSFQKMWGGKGHHIYTSCWVNKEDDLVMEEAVVVVEENDGNILFLGIRLPVNHLLKLVPGI